MTISVRNVAYNAAGTLDMEVQFRAGGDWLPFTASPDDVEQIGRDLYQKAMNGDYGTIAGSQPTSADLLQQKREAASLPKEEFMLALLNAGMLDQAKAAIQSAGVTEEFKIYWQYTANVGRTSKLVTFLQQKLGVTDTQVDNVFGIS